jgi:hypothetical protein
MAAVRTIRFDDENAIRDLATFIDRAEAIDNAAVRLVAKDTLLTVWVQVLAPRGLNDATPTVLGLRGMTLAAAAKFDVVVPIESLRVRLDNAAPDGEEFVVTLPLESPSISWKIPLPTQAGWESLGKVSSNELESVAREGMKIVSKKTGRSSEEFVVRSVRSQVWGTTINNSLGLPAGVALAAEALGFFGEKTFSVWSKQPWIRLSGERGEIVAKSTEVVVD